MGQLLVLISALGLADRLSRIDHEQQDVGVIAFSRSDAVSDEDGRRVFAMESARLTSTWPPNAGRPSTGRDAILDGAGQTFTQVKAKRLGETPARQLKTNWHE